ncbi:Putative dimethyl sulfoxide reductase chain YnfE [Sporomusa rhizae]|uniref:molybdopterin-containing oxidoreductase family protein n=1 Tax=Sporomusa rhizae TaxID=357999 RepID=UPI00352A1418
MNGETKLFGKSLKFSRRTFIKTAGSIGAGMSFGVPMFRSSLAVTAPLIEAETETYRSTCNMECLHCNLTAHVTGGKLVKVEASQDFHVKGCLRGLSRIQWVNHPDRLKYPMKRVGEKGEGKFQRISWDEALDTIATKLRQTKAELGNKGIFLMTASGNMSALTNSTASAFFDYFGGAVRTSGSLCCSAVTAAMVPMLGIRYVDTRDTIADSKYLLCWGNNPAVTMQAYFKEFAKALKQGARMVVIDPRFSETAAKADEWVPINPGTDTALALGMLNVIIQEKLYDEKYLLEHTSAPFLVDASGDLALYEGKKEAFLVYDGITGQVVPHDHPGVKPMLTLAGSNVTDYKTVFDLIASECAQWPTAKVEKETDVPAQTVLRLAREYAVAKPAMIVQNMSGAQRTEYGAYVAMSQFYLALFTGSYGIKGGGVLDAGGVTQFFSVKPPVKPKAPTPGLPTIPISKVGEWIANDKPNPIGFAWFMTSSPVTQNPNTNAVKAALKRVPFVVVADNLMTSTALYADMLLPVCTVFEETNLMAGIRSHYVQLMEKAVEPPGEAKSDIWIMTELAKRLGFGETFDKPIEKYIEAVLDGTGITLDQIKKAPVKPVATPYIPFAGGKFRTPSGKAMLFVQDWKTKKNLSPIATYYRPVESPLGSPELFKKYPLMAVQRKQHRSIHSSFSTLPYLNEATTNRPHLMLHPDDAANRGIHSGDVVIAFNERGQHKAVADVTSKIKKGVVSLENGWWEQQGGSSSHVTNDKPEPLGHGQSCNSTLIEVKKEG